MPIWMNKLALRVNGKVYKMRTLSGEEVKVLVPSDENGKELEDLGDNAYKYFDCHSYAVGLWNAQNNSGYVFASANHTEGPSAFTTTIKDRSLFDEIRAPSDDIKKAGNEIKSGDIITFWLGDRENPTKEAIHSVKIHEAPIYESFETSDDESSDEGSPDGSEDQNNDARASLDDSTQVFSKNGSDTFNPDASANWGDIKKRYQRNEDGTCKFAVYRHAAGIKPWWS